MQIGDWIFWSSMKHSVENIQLFNCCMLDVWSCSMLLLCNIKITKYRGCMSAYLIIFSYSRIRIALHHHSSLWHLRSLFKIIRRLYTYLLMMMLIYDISNFNTVDDTRKYQKFKRQTEKAKRKWQFEFCFNAQNFKVKTAILTMCWHICVISLYFKQRLKEERELKRSQIDARHDYVLSTIAHSLGLEKSEVDEAILEGNQVMCQIYSLTDSFYAKCLTRECFCSSLKNDPSARFDCQAFAGKL